MFIRERPWLEMVIALALVGGLYAISRGVRHSIAYNTVGRNRSSGTCRSYAMRCYVRAWARAYPKGLESIPVEEELVGDWKAKTEAKTGP
jgi:hypothetical protein